MSLETEGKEAGRFGDNGAEPPENLSGVALGTVFGAASTGAGTLPGSIATTTGADVVGQGAFGADSPDTVALPGSLEGSVGGAACAAGVPVAGAAGTAKAAAAAFTAGEAAGVACEGSFLPAYGRVDADTGTGHGAGGTANVCAGAADAARHWTAGVVTPGSAPCDVETCVTGEADGADVDGWLGGGAAEEER